MSLDDEDEGPPRTWVEAFYESESEVRGVLDDVREAHLLGDHETVREQLRAFAQTEEGIFRMVALAVLDVDEFYDDLEAQYEDCAAPTAELRELGAEYDRLSNEFELIFAERTRDLRNPMPTLRRGFRYTESSNLPLLDYDVYSGNLKLCQFVHPPSQALILARNVVASTRELLERVDENGDEIAPNEREQLTTVYEHLEQELVQMEDVVEREDAAVDADDLETYEDWSFY